MEYVYKPKGTCSTEMIININDEDVIESVKIIGGCPGNTVGLSILVKGQKVDDIIEKLKGIPCRTRGTSCPDQLAIALEGIKKSRK